MSEIILLVGIPASGKSTWRKEFLKSNSNYVCVSRDDLRFMLRDEPFLFEKENLVTDIVNFTIENSIKNGYNVIVDQTNVNEKYLNVLVDFCQNLADLKFILFNISLEEAIKRDSCRDRRVGEDIIKKMHDNYISLINSDFNFNRRKKNEN